MNERIGFEREVALLETATAEFETAQDVGTPVLVLDRAETNFWNAPFVRKPSQLFRAVFCKPFASPSMVFTVFGHVEIEAKGMRRPLVKADKRTFARLQVTTWIRANAGVSAAAGGSAWVKDDGTFASTSSAVTNKSAHRISMRVDLEWKGGKISTDAAMDYSDLDCFIQLIRRYERLKPAGQTNFEFLSSVRKMFQPAAGSPLAGWFPKILDRTKTVQPVETSGNPRGKDIYRFQTMEINRTDVDIGHVLVGIEAHRRQKPGASGLDVPWSGDVIEAFLTWIGDLAGVLAWVAQQTPLAGSGPKPNLNLLLSEKASYEDLRGDLDGINVGAIYDESLDFGANLLKYYEATPFRRFRTFIANAKDSTGNQLFQLIGGKVDPAGRAWIASKMETFVHGYLVWVRKDSQMTVPQKLQALAIGRAGSQESNAIIDYFYEFLNKGLASEP